MIPFCQNDFSQKNDSSYRLNNTLGPLCLWQCFFCLHDRNIYSVCFPNIFPVKALGREQSSLGNHGEAERYPGIQPPQKIKETKIIERMKIQRTRTAKQKKTKRKSDPIVAFMRYVSPSDVVHPKINNLTYISRHCYLITETKFLWTQKILNKQSRVYRIQQKFGKRTHTDSIWRVVFSCPQTAL